MYNMSRKHASVMMSFNDHLHGVFVNNFYLYKKKTSDPLPPSLHCKDRKFSPNFDSFLNIQSQLFSLVT